MPAAGAADVESVRFKLVLPASDGFAVRKMESKGPSCHLNTGGWQGLPDYHLLPHAKFCTSGKIWNKTSGQRAIGVATVGVMFGMTNNSGIQRRPPSVEIWDLHAWRDLSRIHVGIQ